MERLDGLGEENPLEPPEASPKRGRMAMTCEGGKTTGTMDWSAPTPERMEGRVEMTSRRGAAETRMTATTTGRWLAAECGDVSTD